MSTLHATTAEPLKQENAMMILKEPTAMSDRKYRHRGYQDDDRDREQQRPKPKPSGPRNYDDGPRGRGLGAPTNTAFRCARCGRELVNITVENDTTCPGCQSPLHSCSNCSLFDTGAPDSNAEKSRGTRVSSRRPRRMSASSFYPKRCATSGSRRSESGRATVPAGPTRMIHGRHSTRCSRSRY